MLSGLLAAWRWTGNPLAYLTLGDEERVVLHALSKVAAPEEVTTFISGRGNRGIVGHKTHRVAKLADLDGLPAARAASPSAPREQEVVLPPEPDWEKLDDTVKRRRAGGAMATDRAWVRLQWMRGAVPA